MTQYRLFFASFIISILAFITFFAAYFNGIMNVIRLAGHHQSTRLEDPFQVLSMIFSPVLLVSIVVLGITSLLYRVLGIIFIAKNKKLDGGEQALWIIGFILFGFITAIVFMAMSKSRNLTSGSESNIYKEVEP